jgi:hypothetical protein
LHDGKVLIEKQTEKQKITMPLDSLVVGTYRFQLVSTYNGETSMDAYPFSIVDASTLPDEIAYIDTADIPQSIRTLLHGVILAHYPEWRFMALQQAIRVKDRPLARVLLEEESH